MISVRLFVSAALLALGPLLAACSANEESLAGNSPNPTPTPDEDERGSVGVPPPAAEYCKKLGYPIEGDDCVFPDGSKCEQWSFYRGECGQAHSFCNTHGGTISTKTEDMGGWTAVYGLCSLDGKECKESEFFVEEKCD